MAKLKTSLVVLLSVISTILFSSCSRMPSVVVGNYYLNGESTNAYIHIINKSQLLFHGFDIDALVEGLRSGVGLEGKDMDDFGQELHYVYSSILDFKVDWAEDGYRLYIMTDYLPGYSIKIEDANTLSFLYGKYIRP